MISSTTLQLVREATALRTTRSDLALRPCLPIAQPRSSFATRSSSIEAMSPRVSLTSTALGLLTNCCATNSSHSLVAASADGTKAVIAGASRLLVSAQLAQRQQADHPRSMGCLRLSPFYGSSICVNAESLRSAFPRGLLVEQPFWVATSSEISSSLMFGGDGLLTSGAP